MATRGGKRSNSGRAKLVDPVQLMFGDPPAQAQERCQWIISAVRKVEADKQREWEAHFMHKVMAALAGDSLEDIRELQSTLRRVPLSKRRSVETEDKISDVAWHFDDWTDDPDHDPKLHSESPKLARVYDIPPMPPVWRGKIFAKVVTLALAEKGWRISRGQIKRCLAEWAAFEKRIASELS